MSNGDTTNLGPQLEASAGPRFSVIDMGDMVGPERMNTMGMLKAELRSVYEDNSVVQTVNRAVADPGEALIGMLKPLMVLVALVVGFVGAALIMESQASANAEAPAATVAPAVPEPEPAVAALASDELTEEEELAEEVAEEELLEEAEEPEPEAAVAEETKEPARKVRKLSKRAKRKKHKKRSKKRRRRRR